jgi:septum formation protein
VPQRPRFVLASASPRRASLLKQAGIIPDAIIPPEIDETPSRGELPRAYVQRMGLEKVKAVAAAEADAIVLAADTIVACGRRILPKAEDAAEVERCLNMLSGRRHRVLTAIAVSALDGKIRQRLVMTQVAFKRLSAAEIESYCAGGEGVGKAGGYGIQGRAECFIRRINGSYSNVVGLPMFDAVALLSASGYA